MAIQFQCPSSGGQPGPTITLNTAGGGNAQPVHPTFNAKRINLSFQDVQETIQEGRMFPTRPFSMSGSTDMKN